MPPSDSPAKASVPVSIRAQSRALRDPMDCCGTTQLSLRVRPLCPDGHGPPSRPIRCAGMRQAPPRAKAMSCHRTPRRNPPASPILDALRNVLRTGTADHQLPHQWKSAFDPHVTSSSRADRHRIKVEPRSNKCGGSESRHNVTLIVPVHPAIASHRLLHIPTVQNALGPITALLPRTHCHYSDWRQNCNHADPSKKNVLRCQSGNGC